MTHRRRLLLSACAAGLGMGLLLGGACSREESGSSDVPAEALSSVNDKCPMCKKAVNVDVATQMFDESEVGFCSDECSGQWSRLEDRRFGHDVQQSFLDAVLSDN